ncbi:DNA/RNA non-specific endonuclease [Proteus alimentorum]|uniref:DNA/RNA non-specific endonuclease n=1 Tax=Proteus alimentorum TaxID=1973495 RepID=UPI000BFFF719|nr:DNA/RNA non-specific endonuclease [Proteus alimentorum]
MRDTDNQQQDIAQLSQDTDNAHSTLTKIFDKEKEQNRQQKQQLVGEIGAQIIDLATTVDTIRGTNIAKEESTLNRLSDTAYDDIYQALSEIKENVTERDIQNHLFQQALQNYTNQSDFGTGGKYTRAIQAITAFTQGMMGNNIVTAIANGSAPYLANEVKNQIQGSSVESDIQRTLAHGLVNAGLALAKGENAMAQATGAMTGELVNFVKNENEQSAQSIFNSATFGARVALGSKEGFDSIGISGPSKDSGITVRTTAIRGNENNKKPTPEQDNKESQNKIEPGKQASGSKGNWNKELNKPKQNMVYTVDGNKVYQTDSLGRVTSVTATLELNKSDRNGYQQCKVGKCGDTGDDGGHLIATRFSGPGEKINMVPMNSNLNRSEWKKMENIWARSLKENKEVNVKIEPVYIVINQAVLTLHTK